MKRCLFFCGIAVLMVASRANLFGQQAPPPASSGATDSSSSAPASNGSWPQKDQGTKQDQGSKQNQDAKKDQGSTTLPKNPVQPPASSLSPDLTFPGDDPGQPPASSNSGATNSAATKPSATTSATPDLAPPRSDRVRVDDLGNDVGQSSSKDTQEDLTPPDDDEKAHPKSAAVMEEAAAGISAGGVSEFKQWSPQKAAKDIEVGDFYFKRKNYKAAEERYREALTFKENDAVATFKLAVSLEKLLVFDDARGEYESYLKILPHGPEAGDAEKALERLRKVQ